MKTTSQPNTSNWVVIYRKRKDDRINYLNNHYSGHSNTKRKKPWYTMTSGKCYNYEERTESWGQCVNLYRVHSEIGKLNRKNTPIKKMGRADFMERMSQHKLSKWINKHPEPDYKQDLFPKEYRKAYQDAKDQALARIRDIVVSIYDKTVVPIEKSNCKLVPIVKNNDHTYRYDNIDPYTIGYPLCQYSTQRFIHKETLKKIARNSIDKVKKSGLNCIGIEYIYKDKKLFELAA